MRSGQSHSVLRCLSLPLSFVSHLDLIYLFFVFQAERKSKEAKMRLKHDKAISLHNQLIGRITASNLEKEVISCLRVACIIVASLFFFTSLTCLFIFSYGSTFVSFSFTGTSKGQARQNNDPTKDILFVKRACSWNSSSSCYYGSKGQEREWQSAKA